MNHPSTRNLTRLTSFYGDDFDVDVFTNGGTYHTVIVTNFDDGSWKEHQFYNRAKALAFAEDSSRRAEEFTNDPKALELADYLNGSR